MLRIFIIGVIFEMVLQHHEAVGISTQPGNIDTYIDLSKHTVEYQDSFAEYLLNNPDNAIDTVIDRMRMAMTLVDGISANSLETTSLNFEIADEVDDNLSELLKHVVRVQGLYDNFRYYLANFQKFNNRTIDEFIKVATSNDKGGLQTTLSEIYKITMPDKSLNNNTNIFDYIKQKIDDSGPEYQCGADGSVHQRLFEVFNTIAVAEARGHIMAILAYAVQTVYKNESYEQQMKESAAHLVLRVQDYLLAAKKGLASASTEYRRCDPYRYKRGESFVEFEKLMQLSAISENDLGKGSCTSTCEELSGYAIDCNPNDHWCPQEPCEGSFHYCRSAGTMKACEMPSDSPQRFQWFRDVNNVVYGNDKTCDGTEVSPFGWWRVAYYCDMCICICIEENRPSRATRAFNLRPQITDVSKNMVITGIKIVSSDRMIQFQIKEGKLLPGGRIDMSTDKWRDLERFEYSTDFYGGGFYFLKSGRYRKPMKASEDYGFFWPEQRLLDLDDLFAEDGYVVTGIKMDYEYEDIRPDEGNWNHAPFQMRIRVTEYDFETGELNIDSDASLWITANDMKGLLHEYGEDRSLIALYNADNPLKAKKNLPVSKPNQRIRFGVSDFEKDAGRATIPFLDSQPLTAEASIPLSGVGLFYKSATGFGGFLALRTYSVDYSKKFKTDISSDMLEKYKEYSSDSQS